MKRIIILALAATLVAGCSTEEPRTSGGTRPQVVNPAMAREVDIIVDEGGLSPSVIEARPGESIRLDVANPTDESRRITIDSGGSLATEADIPARSNGTVELMVPTASGDYTITFNGGTAILWVR